VPKVISRSVIPGPTGAFTRLVAIDIASGNVKAQYAYPLFATRPGKYTSISEIAAVNDHRGRA
jgi:hypothetical protein